MNLGDAYEAAWDEWVEDGGEIWDLAVGDGLSAEEWEPQAPDSPPAAD